MSDSIRFVCPTCKAVLEAGIKKAGSKINCLQCGQRLQIPPAERANTILALGIGDAASPAVTGVQAGRPTAELLPANPAHSKPWHYRTSQMQGGPISAEEMRNLVSSGKISPTDWVWQDGMPNWQRASAIQAFAGPSLAPLSALVKAFGIVTIVYGSLMLLGSLCTLVASAALSGLPGNGFDQVGMVFQGLIGLAAGGTGITGGIGILQRQTWGRYLALATAGLGLLSLLLFIISVGVVLSRNPPDSISFLILQFVWNLAINVGFAVFAIIYERDHRRTSLRI